MRACAIEVAGPARSGDLLAPERTGGKSMVRRVRGVRTPGGARSPVRTSVHRIRCAPPTPLGRDTDRCGVLPARRVRSPRSDGGRTAIPDQEVDQAPTAIRSGGPRSTESPAAARDPVKRLMGLEPTTFCMASRRSSQLSYSRMCDGQRTEPQPGPSSRRTALRRLPEPAARWPCEHRPWHA